MRAAKIEDEKLINVVEIDEPDCDGEHVIIRVTGAVVSGYDINLWKLGKIKKDMGLGHELVAMWKTPAAEKT